MGKKFTEKSRYPSLYSPGGFVTGAQYILELICEKKAKNEGKDLQVKFWQDEEWAAYFKQQLRAVHSLLKKYSEKAIIDALRDKRCFRTYSLRAPWLKAIIEEKQKIIDVKRELAERAEANKPAPLVNQENVTGFRSKRKTNNILDKLEEIDNGEEENG